MQEIIFICIFAKSNQNIRIMNTDKETNINIRLNELSSDSNFRISYEHIPGVAHKKYVPQYTNENGEWTSTYYFKDNTQEKLLASFSNIRKAKRFFRKLLIGNNIEIPEEFQVIENN